MVWLNWRGGLVVVGAWVALACGQAFTQSELTPGKTERILTLYENGKAVRCRVIGTWTEAGGQQAHQLQSLETGELITIVEASPATPTSAGAPEGRRSIRTRNFHWGMRNRTPPADCPMPPNHILTAACDSCGPAGSGGFPGTPRDPVITTRPPIVLNSTPIPEKTEYHWWEEKEGKRVSPVLVTKGQNPFETEPALPSRTVTGPDLPGLNGPRTVITGPVLISPPVPATSVGRPTGGTPVGPGLRGGMTTVAGKTTPGKTTPRKTSPGTSALGKSVAGTTPPIVPFPSGLKSDPVLAGPGKTRTFPATPPESLDPGPVTSEPGVSGLATAGIKKPSPKGVLPASGNPSTRTGPRVKDHGFPDLPGPVVSTRTGLPVNKSVGDRVRILLGFKHAPTVVAARDLPKTIPWKTGAVTPTEGTKPATVPDRVPFSTVAVPDKPGSKPSTTDTPGQEGVKTAKGTKITDPTVETPAKKDWRTMWGSGTDSPVQAPGQSLTQAAVKPGKGPYGMMRPYAGDSRKDDILFKPERFDPAADRYTPKGIDLTGGAKKPFTELPLTAPGSDLPGTLLPPVTTDFPPGTTTMPLGVQSVLAAKSGITGPITYLPVPITTVPEPAHPPLPPPPRMPEPPQPNMYLNAFTPPPAHPGMALKPPMTPPTMMPAGMMLPPSMPPGGMAYPGPAYPGMMPPGMVPPGMMHPGMVPAGMTPPGMMYPGMMHPGMMHPGMVPPGMMHPGMAPPGMAGPAIMGPGAVSGTPANPYPVARHYSGPTAPNPFGATPTQPIMPVGYVQPAPGPSGQMAQLLTILRESLYPAQRQWAARQLANFDWRSQPEVIPALLQAARHDPAATVRADCVYSLARMNAATQPVLETFQALRGDTDPLVRQEAENAVARLGAGR